MKTKRLQAAHHVGIMGGTFDPIHYGHLILGERAYEEFHLEKVLFLPNGNPPHKQDRADVTSARDRLEMVRLAIADNPHFELDDEEVRREGYSYTKDTLRRMQERNPDTAYYFIIGEDSLMSFHQWYHPEEICRYCTLLAAVRGNLPEEPRKKQIAYLSETIGADILEMDTPQLPFASSHIRDLVIQGRSFRYYVPEAVRTYISERKLYTT